MRKTDWVFLIFPISQIMILAGEFMGKGNATAFFYIGLAFGLISDVILLYFLLRGRKKEALEKALEEMVYLKDVENFRNDLLEQQQKQIQEIKKILEVHMQDLDALERYLEETRTPVYCMNPVVNAVVSEKEKKCSELGFQLENNLIVPKEMNVEPLHICSIFSNLLDNALEAVSELEKSQRKIMVYAEIKGNYFIVKVVNSAAKAHVNRKIRKGHGYGTRILDDITKKYDGNFHSFFENGLYTAVVAIKVG